MEQNMLLVLFQRAFQWIDQSSWVRCLVAVTTRMFIPARVTICASIECVHVCEKPNDKNGYKNLNKSIVYVAMLWYTDRGGDIQ